MKREVFQLSNLIYVTDYIISLIGICIMVSGFQEMKCIGKPSSAHITTCQYSYKLSSTKFSCLSWSSYKWNRLLLFYREKVLKTLVWKFIAEEKQREEKQHREKSSMDNNL